jgi:hypothetical protein
MWHAYEKSEMNTKFFMKELKGPLCRRRLGMENNIKMDVKEKGEKA